MSGNTTFLRDTALMRAIAKRLSDPNARLTLAEETGFGRFAGARGLAGTDPSGFPSAPGGDVNGWNSLCRTNWFNGRFLTAEALRRQDTYFDYRSRLNAHTSMPGIAHGLGLKATGANTSTYDSGSPNLTGGFSATQNIVLHPGLAFDMIGRPILVPADFSFTLAQLISLQRAKPRRVVGGGTVFAPCVCLAPDPEGPQGGSPAVRPGPYLLIIEAAEHASGEAKVYGAVCSDNQPITCEADAWCAGFGLSLVRFPVEVPFSDSVRSHWDLRGILSAYYYDVFEHSLIKRWDSTFAKDDGFCIGTGPGRNDAGAIALAMVYLGTDGSALFLDSWIPRRTIVDSPGEDWHRTRFGAPPRAASWARIYQFQCMLAESLTKEPIRYTPPTAASTHGDLRNFNLLRRGFRHIPPIGYLPIDPAIAKQQTTPPRADVGSAGLDALINAGAAAFGLVSGFAMAAEVQALTYFRDTNVLAYGVVALHDDDILEDLSNVFDKDPIQLDFPPGPAALTERFKAVQGASSSNPGAGLLADLAFLFMSDSLAHLVNRRVEVVKLVVPLQGLTRSHPILGVVEEDAADQASSWGAPVAGGSLLGAFAAAGLRQPGLAADMLPRQFVVYVKQRMVLLDVIFVVIEMFQLILKVASGLKQSANQASGSTGTANAPGGGAGAAPAGSTGANFVPTATMRQQFNLMPAQQRSLTQSALAHPSVRVVLAQALPLAAPDLAVASRAQMFQTQVNAQDAALEATVPDRTMRRQQAIDRVSDSYAAVYPGYQFVQMVAATQPADQTEAIVGLAGTSAATVLGGTQSGTVADAALKDGVPIFASPDAAGVFFQVNAANAEKPAQSLVPGVRADLTVGEVLSKSPAEAAALLGGAKNLETFSAAIARQTKSGADAVTGIAMAIPAGAVDKLNAALTRGGGDLTKALDAVRADTASDAATRTYFERAALVARALGPSKAPVLTTLLTRRA